MSASPGTSSITERNLDERRRVSMTAGTRNAGIGGLEDWRLRIPLGDERGSSPEVGLSFGRNGPGMPDGYAAQKFSRLRVLALSRSSRVERFSAGRAPSKKILRLWGIISGSKDGAHASRHIVSHGHVTTLQTGQPSNCFDAKVFVGYLVQRTI